MSATPLSYEQFLRRLAATRGTARKLRLLARYWHQVERLQPAQRERLALAMGTRLAWDRLEKLFAADGRLSDGERLVKQALERLGTADPDELRRLARSVREGDAGALRDGLAVAVREALESEARDRLEESRAGEEEATAAQPPPPAVADDVADAPAEAAAPDQAVPVEEVAPPTRQTSDGAEPAAAAATVSPPPGTPSVAAPEPPAEAVPEPSPPVEPPAPDRGVAVEPEATAVEAAAEPAASPAVGPPPAPERLAEGELPGAPAGATAAGPEESVEAWLAPATGKLAMLRALHRAPRRAASLGRDERARLLTRLGPGWTARRGLSQLIRSHALEDLDEALTLIADLRSPAEKTWCLGDLLEHWELDGEARGRVLAAAPTASTRRRLAGRPARGRRALPARAGR